MKELPTPAEVLAKLKQNKRPRDSKYDTVISMDSGLCVLKCKACGKELWQPTPAMHLRRNLWLQASEQYPLFAAAAVRLMSCHASSCAADRNWSAWGCTYTSLRNRLSKEKAEQLILVKPHMAAEQETEDE